MIRRSPHFWNPPKPKLDTSERAYLRRLMDLEEVARLTDAGEIATTRLLMERIHPVESLRQAERVAQDLQETARLLGYEVRREQEDPSAPVGSPENLFRFTFDDLGGLLEVVNEKIAELTGASRGSLSYDFRRYHALAEAGRCVRCKTAEARPGKVHCADCARWWQDYYQRLRESGVCTVCKEAKASDGRATCAKCRAASRRATKERRATGVCTGCGVRPPAEGKLQCDTCAMPDYHAARYRDLKAKGLCRCKKPARPGKATCQACFERQQRADQRRIEHRKANKLCVKCGAPANEGSFFCEKHAEKWRTKSAARSSRARESGICRECKGPGRPGLVLCQGCADALRDKKATAIEQGFCSNCYKRPKAEGLSTCEECRVARNQRWRDRVARGLCGYCGKPARPDRATCEKHAGLVERDAG